ncbi:response regulator transcription factor [Gephyromycinifex aptenodytis]|uniref:response regulator transcription factor n=1 Tax=Gephyromycinifex aptenodytis TaxID=2716227 RepID=UPI0014462E79|nr:response regulator transcription factor [Gephyromycinifex aptenodytis]
MRLLVVEDEPGMVRALRRGLAAEGFLVEVARDGPTGLDMARFGDFDAVLLDVMLPGLSGYEVVRTLRAEENWVPVLMVSAKDGEYDQADGLDCGADDYLTKPFSFVVLLARLRSLLRRAPAPRPTIMTAGGVSFDPASHEVQVEGASVALSAREALLLEYLIRAFPHPVSKERLLENIWAESSGDPNVVEVFIGHLRRKIGRERITTVRGVGYRLSHDGVARAR